MSEPTLDSRPRQLTIAYYLGWGRYVTETGHCIDGTPGAWLIYKPTDIAFSAGAYLTPAHNAILDAQLHEHRRRNDSIGHSRQADEADVRNPETFW